MRKLLTYTLLLMTLTLSAQTDSVRVNMSNDSIGMDTLVADTMQADTLRKKKPNIFKRVYNFLDRVFSPPRDLKYIDVQDYYNWCGMVQLTTRFEVYQLDAGEEDFILRLSPKPRTRIGPFFGWRFAFFGYNIDLKSIFMNSDDTDLAASIYSAAFGADLFYRRVGGNYNINKLKVRNVDMTPSLKGQPFDGVQMGMTRISLYYIPNYKHYSHQAAFSQTHRQLISAGSMIFGVSYAHNRCTIDWSKLTEMVNSINNTDQYKNVVLSGNQKNDEFALTCGYGYNWVFAKNWLLGLEITGSLGYLNQHVDAEMKENTSFLENIDAQIRKNIAFDGTTRLALVYNSGPIYTGMQSVCFYYQHGNGVMMSRNLIASLYAFVGYNF